MPGVDTLVPFLLRRLRLLALSTRTTTTSTAFSATNIERSDDATHREILLNAAPKRARSLLSHSRSFALFLPSFPPRLACVVRVRRLLVSSFRRPHSADETAASLRPLHPL